MRTSKQIQASRANGTRSKGPVTAQGKRNSSRNSTRHGLLAETVVLKEEHTGRFLDLLNELIADHQPVTATEVMLVETIAVANWRRSRIWGMQKENFDHDVASCDVDTDSPALCAVLALRSSPDSIRSHELLLRYEVAFDRQISRALLRLQKLQDRAEKRKEESIEPPSATPSAKDAARTLGANEEIIGRHSVLRDSKPSAKDAARTLGTNEEITARHSVLRYSKNAERTQQPAETKQPATATHPNTNSPRTPEPPQDVQCPPKLPVSSALLPGDVRFKRVRQ